VTDTPPIDPRRFLSATIIGSPLSDVDEVLRRIFDETIRDGMMRSQAALDIDLIYGLAPPPGGAHLYKTVVYVPRLVPNVSILIANLRDGWSSLSYLVSKKLGKFQLQIISTEDGVEYPQNKFEVWRAGTSARSVMAMRDSDKWVFYQRGETECFEEPQLYSKRRISERLTREILIRYLQSLDWDIESREFWESAQDAIYYSQLRKRPVVY
jgi:hypothetical protein